MPRATFYPKLETNSAGFNNADLWPCPTYKMALRSPKKCDCKKLFFSKD